MGNEAYELNLFQLFRKKKAMPNGAARFISLLFVLFFTPAPAQAVHIGQAPDIIESVAPVSITYCAGICAPTPSAVAAALEGWLYSLWGDPYSISCDFKGTPFVAAGSGFTAIVCSGTSKSGGSSARSGYRIAKCPDPGTGNNYLINMIGTEMCDRYVRQTQQDSLTITLTPETATLEPDKTYSFTATVTKQGGGAPSQAVPVSVKVEVDPTSGGHDHGEAIATRPKGSVSPATGNTVLLFTFTATPVSGKHTITATCDLCVNKTATAEVQVKVKDLTSLTSSSAFALVGGEPGKKHTDNHYLAAEAKGRLEDIIKKYNLAYPKGPLLRLNDASLEWGGKFDILGNWGGAHAEHRRGVVIDIRANLDATAIPEIRFFDFEDIAARHGAQAELHCSKEFSKYIVGCIADSGSNRHFHVRLLGENAKY